MDMDTFFPPPLMTAEEAATLASEWAGKLVKRLDEHSEKFPRAVLSPEEEDYFQKEYGDKTFPPYPKDFISTFESIFCRYLAARYTIVP